MSQPKSSAKTAKYAVARAGEKKSPAAAAAGLCDAITISFWWFIASAAEKMKLRRIQWTKSCVANTLGRSLPAFFPSNQSLG